MTGAVWKVETLFEVKSKQHRKNWLEAGNGGARVIQKRKYELFRPDPIDPHMSLKNNFYRKNVYFHPRKKVCRASVNSFKWQTHEEKKTFLHSSLLALHQSARIM